MTRFVPNKNGMDALARTTDMQKSMKEYSDSVAESARGIAPELSGDYVDGIESVGGVDNGMAIGRVNANDWKSALIEWGTTDTPTFAPLRKAAEQQGLKLTGGR